MILDGETAGDAHGAPSVMAAAAQRMFASLGNSCTDAPKSVAVNTLPNHLLRNFAKRNLLLDGKLNSLLLSDYADGVFIMVAVKFVARPSRQSHGGPG